MNRSGTARGWSQSSVVERSRWDSAVKARRRRRAPVVGVGRVGFRHWGFTVERVRVDGPRGTGLAQVMVWPHGPVADARLARGPLLSGDGAAVAHELFAAVDEVCERYRPLTLIVEPPAPASAHR